MTLRLAVLVSGGGTTLQNLIDRIAAGRLRAEIGVVISSSAQAYALERAAKAKIPGHIIAAAKGAAVEASSREVFDCCRRCEAGLVVLAGYLKLLQIPDDFAGRVMNIHPALIPSFCGQGFYGERVHAAALERGVKVSGCTVHFADNVYDHGPIIVQRTVPVLEDDDPHALAARVFEAECEAYPEAISLFADGRLAIEGRRVRILPESNNGKHRL